MPSSLRNRTIRCLSFLPIVLLAGALVGRPVLAQSTIDAVIHYVEGKPSEEKIAYDVTAYVSVVDSTGNPIKDLKAEDFTLAEDSQLVEVLGAALAPEAPINLILLLDTSGSMGGPGINSAKAAASNFIAGLNPEDRVAVATFDDTVQIIIDFTTDHRAAREELSLVSATPGAGTCLYDAAYQAVQMTATVPSGRRAVVLFTDGVDEKAGGGACSVHDADDVIDIANQPGTRTPIYTLGMGSKVDQKSLQRMAQDTGGRFLYSPDAGQLEAVFFRLSDTLRSQYAIQYSSTAGPGSHTLAVTTRYLGAQDTDTRGFLLPNFPLRLTFVEPREGQEVRGMTALEVETFGQGETIQSVVFQINGATVASVGKTPYEAQVDLGKYAAGDLTIEAVAQGAGGIELARVSRTVKVISSAITPTVTPGPDEKEDEFPISLLLIIGGILLLGGLFVVIIVVVILRKRKEKAKQEEERLRDLEWEQKVGGVGEATVEAPVGAMDRTMDAWEMSPEALAMLTVTASDDPSMIGQRFELIHSRTTLGRKADNDIIFPKDSPVSRHHAVIEERGGGLFLSQVVEVDDAGKSKSPTYGTFVNESGIGDQQVLLQNSDEIRLGKRVKMKFELSARLRMGEEKTFDGFETIEDNDTMQTRDG